MALIVVGQVHCRDRDIVLGLMHRSQILYYVIQCGVAFNFFASYSNILYGKSSVVQPNANRVFFIIKY